jgi:hypothetical protein
MGLARWGELSRQPFSMSVKRGKQIRHGNCVKRLHNQIYPAEDHDG